MSKDDDSAADEEPRSSDDAPAPELRGQEGIGEDPSRDLEDPAADEAPPDERSPYDASGMARPRFILEFPVDEQLEALISAFERGDYAFVRAHAEGIAERAERGDVREAALELRRRIDPDPLARYVVVASVLLLLFLVAWTYLGHDH